jgi:transcription antitermination factor NusG
MPLLPPQPQIVPESLFDLSERWSVAHVRSRREKLLARHLLQNGVPYYLPQMEKSVQRAGRQFVSHVVLFAGYVFFRGGAAERRIVLRSNVVANLIEVENQALFGEELRQIRRLQLEGASLAPVEELTPGDAVRITEGAFAGYHGVVVHGRRGDRLLVSISLLCKTVSVEFAREALARRRD